MCIFCVSLNLTIVLFGAKTEAKYRDVAPLRKVPCDVHSPCGVMHIASRTTTISAKTVREENNFLRLPRYRARMDNNFPFTSLLQGRSQDFSKWGGGGGSHLVKQYRHGVFATEYCRLFA